MGVTKRKEQLVVNVSTGCQKVRQVEYFRYLRGIKTNLKITSRIWLKMLKIYRIWKELWGEKRKNCDMLQLAGTKMELMATVRKR